MRSYCRNINSLHCIFLAFFLILVCNEKLTGQQSSPILFHSVILDNATGLPLEGAHYQIRRHHAGAADANGMISFYAHYNDTVIFSCIGYKDALMIIADSLAEKEYTAGIFLNTDTLMITGVVVVPRIRNLMYELKSERSATDQNTVNAINNLKISTYQGLTGTNNLGDPAANYQLIKQKQRIEAIEKGGIPSDKMVSLSPFALLPIIYVLAKGLPEEPEPPQPYISPKELQVIKSMRDSLLYRKK